MSKSVRELSLFTGAGGGIYGSKILGWKTVGYVEWEDYPQRIIAQRIRDGVFDEAPIFGDVRAFVSDGYARRYRGLVDVVTGGFPCQPFSVAGKRKASDDERNMWPATMDVIRAVKPRIVFLENVPGLLSAAVDDKSGRPVYYFGEILRDLAEGGYDAKWCVLGADDVGAPHYRKRLWIMGRLTNSNNEGTQRGAPSGQNTKPSGISNVSNTKHNGPIAGPLVRGYEAAGDQRRSKEPQVARQSERVGRPQHAQSIRRGKSRSQYDADNSRNVANPKSDGWEQNQPVGRKQIQQKNGSQISEIRSRDKTLLADTSSTGLEKQHASGLTDRPGLSAGSYAEEWGATWWSVEPGLGRVANGVADRGNRIKAIGNGQVPLTMATAYEILSQQDIVGES